MISELDRVPDLHGLLNLIFSAPVDAVVPDFAFTHHNQLHDLIDLFNTKMRADGREQIDVQIKELRHALAHGRVSAMSDSDDIRLINFKKIAGGKTVIRYSAAMTPQWFKDQRKQIRYATSLVVKFSEEMQKKRKNRIVIAIGDVSDDEIARVLTSD